LTAGTAAAATAGGGPVIAAKQKKKWLKLFYHKLELPKNYEALPYSFLFLQPIKISCHWFTGFQKFKLIKVP
jgi:hypothetical protein